LLECYLFCRRHSMLRRSTVIGMLLATFVLGVGFGSAFFPRTITQTQTQTSMQVRTETETSFTTLTVSNNSSASVATATVYTVLVEPVVARCANVSGTRSIIFVYEFPGESTTVTTIYPTTLQHQFQVTLMTASTVTVSNKTYVLSPDTC